MKKILFFVVAIFAITSCECSKAKTEKTKNSEIINSTEDCVEVLYFHNKKRCITCNAIESLAKEGLENDFAELTKEGKIIFRTIDISNKDNEEIVDKYEVTWSSLILNRQGKVINLTEMGFLYAKGKPEVFKEKFKESMTNILK